MLNKVTTMRIPYVTTFCCLFSVHIGAVLIVYVNNFVAFLAFVSWTTDAFGMYQRLRYNHIKPEYEHTVLAWITIVFGILIVFLHVYMSIVIWTGLLKDDPRYLKAYMRVGYAALLLNTCITVMAFFVYNTLFISLTGLVSIPLQCYFMLVIRSTIKEMIEDHNELSSSRNQPA